jgi:hypothetical protein
MINSMSNFDITKIDIYSFKDLKRGELSNIHSILLFLYSKTDEKGLVSFKYSEIDWLYYHNVLKTINKISDLNIINILQRPTPHDPFIVKLRTNNELRYIINKDKKLNFHLIIQSKFSKEDVKKALDCASISEHFLEPTFRTWVRNINSKVWDISKFLIIAKIVTFFKCDNKVKTFTINKYCSKNQIFSKSIKFLYEKVPDSEKDLLYSQFSNTCSELNIKNDKSFVNIAISYQKYLESLN